MAVQFVCNLLLASGKVNIISEIFEINNILLMARSKELSVEFRSDDSSSL